VSTADARVALLSGLIDHAPTFPPASLPPREALAEDRLARATEERFMLGRLVWPASRWDALGDEQRGVSVVLDAPLPDDGRVESVELRISGDVDRLDGEVYVEVPASAVEELRRLRERGLRAKVRCGGAEVPTIEELAGFIRACRAEGIVFKATAGLHHALRTDTEHGFLNLLAAVVFGDEEQALAETDRDVFGLTAESFSWRGRTAQADLLSTARRDLFHAIGSCSFFEPVGELRDLDMLPT
jgi:hypothetical protein